MDQNKREHIVKKLGGLIDLLDCKNSDEFPALSAINTIRVAIEESKELELMRYLGISATLQHMSCQPEAVQGGSNG